MLEWGPLVLRVCPGIPLGSKHEKMTNTNYKHMSQKLVLNSGLTRVCFTFRFRVWDLGLKP